MRHAHSLLALQAAAAMAPLPWGKRPCQDYLKALREQTPAPLDDGLVECHPLRHLRWTAGVAEEASSPLPPQLDFDARNSACHAAAAAGVDWTAVLRRARAYRGGAPVPVVHCTSDWRVADAESLEVVIACACLDRRVAARRGEGAGVALDLERAAPLLSRAGVRAPDVAAERQFGFRRRVENTLLQTQFERIVKLVAVGSEELDAVILKSVVRGRDHHPSISPH